MAMTEDSVGTLQSPPAALLGGHDHCSNRRRKADVYIPLRRPAQPALAARLGRCERRSSHRILVRGWIVLAEAPCDTEATDVQCSDLAGPAAATHWMSDRATPG